MTKKQLGLKLKKFRLLKDWSQNELAQRAGSTVTRISELELGKTNITLDRLLPILEAAGASLDLVKAAPVKKQIIDDFDSL